MNIMQIAMYVQIIGLFGIVIAIVTSIWSIILQRREVRNQNQKIIELLEKIVNEIHQNK